MTAFVSPQLIADVMGLRERIRSLRDLADAVRSGLPKSALRASASKLFPSAAAQTELIHTVTAQYVWDDDEDARRFLTTPHSELGGKRPVDVALTELGARQIEELLWKLFYGLPV